MFNPVPSTINHHIDHLLSQASDLESEPRFYFLTATFLAVEDHRKRQIRVTPSNCFIEFERFYVRMLSLLMNNYRRPSLRHLQPLTYAYIDYPFTKRNKSYAHLSQFQKMKRNKRLNKTHPELSPHIHAVMLVHPDITVTFDKRLPRFEPLFRELSTINQTLDVKSLPTTDDLKRAMKYSSVLFQNPPPDLQDSDLFITLPKARSEPTYVKTDYEKQLEQSLLADRAFRERHRDGWTAEKVSSL